MNQAQSHIFHFHAKLRVLYPLASACFFSAITCGCGSLPDAKVTYFNAQSKVSFKVVRSVTCDSNNFPLVLNTVTPLVTHGADTKQLNEIQLAKLRGTFNDSDVKFDFYEDGRLKSVNTTMTGQGEAILKAASTLAGSLAAFDADFDKKGLPSLCSFIKEQGGGKPINITYDGTIDTSQVSSAQLIKPDFASEAYAKRIEPAIGQVCAVVTNTGKPSAPVLAIESKDQATLKARQPGWADVSVMTKIPGGCKSNPMWEGRVTVAQLGVDYLLPIPSPAPFGKQTFAATFSEAGALSSTQYASTNGTAQVLGGLNSLAAISPAETTAQQAAEIKAEADLIAQQQRLLQCKADPKNCK